MKTIKFTGESPFTNKTSQDKYYDMLLRKEEAMQIQQVVEQAATQEYAKYLDKLINESD